MSMRFRQEVQEVPRRLSRDEPRGSPTLVAVLCDRVGFLTSVVPAARKVKIPTLSLQEAAGDKGGTLEITSSVS